MQTHKHTHTHTHTHTHREFFVESGVEVDAKIALPGEEEEDKSADVDQANLGRVLAPLIHEVEHRHHLFFKFQNFKISKKIQGSQI